MSCLGGEMQGGKEQVANNSRWRAFFARSLDGNKKMPRLNSDSVEAGQR